ncbi:MAG TPA: NUDIX domain-containing protein [Tepidisphaeraceae bacterium]|jgi:8-oxo-dGTP pyrophosphatase MutT (NUDIX family)
MLTFHAIGDWPPDRVRARWVPSGRRTPPEVERLVEKAWERALRRPGVKLFDGPMCRMERWHAADGTLELDLSVTGYKAFLGTNMSHPELAERFGRDVMANPVGVSPALETADGYLLLGRRNETLAYYPNRTHPFAGALEPRDNGDLFAAVRRELAEELALGDADVLDVRCTGIAEDRALRQPELLFRVSTSRTRGQIAAQVHAEEHGGSLAIPADPRAVAEAIHDPAFTPVAVASLLLWGRIRFGLEWFGESARGMGEAR